MRTRRWASTGALLTAWIALWFLLFEIRRPCEVTVPITRGGQEQVGLCADFPMTVLPDDWDTITVHWMMGCMATAPNRLMSIDRDGTARMEITSLGYAVEDAARYPRTMVLDESALTGIPILDHRSPIDNFIDGMFEIGPGGLRIELHHDGEAFPVFHGLFTWVPPHADPLIDALLAIRDDPRWCKVECP